MILAPIAIFVYNRPSHTRKTVEALQQNKLASESELFIYSDAPKNEMAVEMVAEVREYIKTVDGFKKVTLIERDTNWGLANSIIDGVSKVINEYGKIIVLEDDLITSIYFLSFMNEALNVFKDRDEIISITGFNFSSKFMSFPNDYKEDTYLNIRPMSWSWATWKERWLGIDWEIKDYNRFITNPAKIKEFNRGGTDLTNMLKAQMEGKLNSWYVRWAYHSYLNNKFTVYPRISFVNNLGHDNTGVHCGIDKNNIYSHMEMNQDEKISINKDIVMVFNIVNNFNKAFNVKAISKIKSAIKAKLSLLI